MYGQILTNENEYKVKIMGVCGDVIFISEEDNYKKTGCHYTKEELIEDGWIFPAEKWTPEMDERYYVPVIDDEKKYDDYIWTNDDTDNTFLANNLLCRTKEEAIALTDKMLGAIK